jgi:hypothetical protein
MTESEWQNRTDPTPMLEFLRGKVSDRKQRLFVIAYVRRVWSDFKISETQEAWNAIEVAERYADKLASDKQLQAAHHAVLASPEWDDLAIHVLNAYAGAATAAKVDKAFADAMASDYAARIAPHTSPIVHAERVERCRLLREVMDNPFHPVRISSAWLTGNDGTVPKLAQSIYDARAFDRLPELADALEQAGCANQDILDHCRQPGPHVRGCWVVDLMLGKR